VVVAGHAGDVPTARAGLADPEPAVRAAAVGALARLGVLTEAVVRHALGDSSPVVRRRAALVAGATPDLAVDGALTALLDDPDPVVVEVAAFACGERERVPGATVGRLVEVATGHADALCREAAVAALGAIGEPSGLPAVLAGCRDRATVRRRAVLALAAFDGPEVSAELERLCADRDLQVRQAAEELRAIEVGEDR
jgi:HEAT repeat protein